MTHSLLNPPTGVDYSEIRHHELRKTRMVMVDGNLMANTESSEGGLSARAFNKGYWGFASSPDTSTASAERLSNKAVANASAFTVVKVISRLPADRSGWSRLERVCSAHWRTLTQRS